MGLNYRQHCAEMGWKIPSEPVVFLKPDSALLINNKPFFLPDFSDNIHYEAEVVVKISRVGKSIAAKFAHRYYEEVTVGIDITARDIQERQIKAGLPWDLAKGFDGAAPVGTFISLSDAGQIDNLDFLLSFVQISKVLCKFTFETQKSGRSSNT
jgi:2-keto-4-pentenoate hydratase/2-oxohepta-3-ene-1,7-dioic acid hydratase in catechol pathway